MSHMMTLKKNKEINDSKDKFFFFLSTFLLFFPLSSFLPSLIIMKTFWSFSPSPFLITFFIFCWYMSFCPGSAPVTGWPHLPVVFFLLYPLCTAVPREVLLIVSRWLVHDCGFFTMILWYPTHIWQQSSMFSRLRLLCFLKSRSLIPTPILPLTSHPCLHALILDVASPGGSLTVFHLSQPCWEEKTGFFPHFLLLSVSPSPRVRREWPLYPTLCWFHTRLSGRSAPASRSGTDFFF